ncbi:MAG TPA: RidA family protein [Acetobacteraceae bacterium]|nr:RidA family protein [Acetobacteraceae bacterium]
MIDTIAARLERLGHRLPEVSGPAANYVPVTRVGALAFISGQVAPFAPGDEPGARLGAELSVEAGQKAAAAAALSLLAQIDQLVAGNPAGVRRVARLGVFVAATLEFNQHSLVGNGASDLVVAVLGEAGRHARTAVGVASLPRGAAVEVEAILELAE